MPIILKQTLSASSKADGKDTRQVKDALNRLGYYIPIETAGITQYPDAPLFAAIKKFQRDNNLPVTGAIKPDDATLSALNKAVESAPDGYYIWRSVKDTKARPKHAALDGTMRKWGETPYPGSEFNCRCWAEAVTVPDYINDPPIEPVYPELLLLSVLGIGRPAISIAGKILGEILKRPSFSRNKKLTEHGEIRTKQRNISQSEIENAINTAKERSSVTEKIGKYGTRQLHYKGTNGVTVIIETSGRNAGKVVTLYRN